MEAGEGLMGFQIMGTGHLGVSTPPAPEEPEDWWMFLGENAPPPKDTAAFEGENFVGHHPRGCGEHRTTGERAWCSDCRMWCYPYFDFACIRCKHPEG